MGEPVRERRRRSGILAALLLAPWSPGCDSDEGGPTSPRPPDTGGVRVERVEIVSSPAAGATYLAGEELAFAVWLTSGEPVEAVGEVFLIFDLGLAREPAALGGTEGDWLEFGYRIRRGDYDPDGVSVPAGELILSPDASLRVGGAALDPGVPELPPAPGHRVFARHAPGESLTFAEPRDGSPAASLGLSDGVGCAAPEGFIEIVEAILDANLAGAATLWAQAWQTGRCGTLPAGEAAIFLSAAVEEHDGLTYDLVLAYGPGELVGGERAAANWWTLADFLAPPP